MCSSNSELFDSQILTFSNSYILRSSDILRGPMEVILREHVDNLGKRGEIVKVADGYARNYLLPRKLALVATDGNKKQVERERAKFEAKEGEERKVAEGLASRVDSLDIEIARKVGENDVLF